MEKYRLEEVQDYSLWDRLVAESPQGTIFSDSRYLRAVGRKFALYFVYKGKEIKAGVSLILTDDEKGCELDDLVIYNGIMFRCDEAQKEVKARIDRFKISEYIINELDRRYEKIELALSPHFEDMRPFIWHNYHSPRKSDKFEVDLRYTSFLDITEFNKGIRDEDMDLFNALITVRQYEVRNATKEGLILQESSTIDSFTAFYEDTFEMQDLGVDHEKVQRIRNLLQCLLNEKLIFIYEVKNAQGVISYAVVFTRYKDEACYLYGARKKDSTSKFDGSFCIWESMKKLGRAGIRLLDMEGVNSPHRGWFKLSFGGTLKSYYQIYKNRKGK